MSVAELGCPTDVYVSLSMMVWEQHGILTHCLSQRVALANTLDLHEVTLLRLHRAMSSISSSTYKLNNGSMLFTVCTRVFIYTQ